MRRLLAGFLALLLAGCSAVVDVEHREYLEANEWNAKKLLESGEHLFNEPEELLENYRVNDLIFFDDYAGKEGMKFVYVLKQRDEEGEPVKAVLFTVDGKLIGGYGILPSWTPGVFSLEDKPRLLEEGKVK